MATPSGSTIAWASSPLTVLSGISQCVGCCEDYPAWHGACFKQFLTGGCLDYLGYPWVWGTPLVVWHAKSLRGFPISTSSLEFNLYMYKWMYIMCQIFTWCSLVLYSSSQDQRTALHHASESGHHNTVRVLLERGANCKKYDKVSGV